MDSTSVQCPGAPYAPPRRTQPYRPALLHTLAKVGYLKDTHMPASRVRSPALWLPLGARQASALAKAAGVIAAGMVAMAVLVAVTPWAMGVRAALALSLVALAGAFHPVLARRRRPPAGWLVLDHRGVTRPGQPPVVDWADPFGLTV